jgi:hypothetical protein
MFTTIEACSVLVETGIRLLQQAELLLGRIDDQEYAGVPPAIAPHRVGGHLRHILEFYECFLDGVAQGFVDYDARRRDMAVEKDRWRALVKIRAVIDRLRSARFEDDDALVRVRMEDGDSVLRSSIGRELQVLASHTVHHFALMALVLRMVGVAVESDFGMAPSTLRYMAEAAKCAR